MADEVPPQLDEIRELLGLLRELLRVVLAEVALARPRTPRGWPLPAWSWRRRSGAPREGSRPTAAAERSDALWTCDEPPATPLTSFTLPPARVPDHRVGGLHERAALEISVERGHLEAVVVKQRLELAREVLAVRERDHEGRRPLASSARSTCRRRGSDEGGRSRRSRGSRPARPRDERTVASSTRFPARRRGPRGWASRCRGRARRVG